jgi:hypothetical protein
MLAMEAVLTIAPWVAFSARAATLGTAESPEQVDLQHRIPGVLRNEVEFVRFGLPARARRASVGNEESGRERFD